jgi:membrane associated rhomboid family serine protease
MFESVLRDFARRPPLLSLSLVASCLVTTIPQFFLGATYDSLTGDASTRNLAFFPLVSFSHDPKILFAHLALNVSVFAFFGSVLETVLGRSRFALLTITTFLTSTALVFTRGTPSHGASGICWGYQAFLVFILIAHEENAEPRARKNPWVFFYATFILFNFVGTPAFEALNGVRLGDNYGQYVHLASNVVVLPLLLRWRKDIEARVVGSTVARRAERRRAAAFPVIALVAILVYNLVATALAAHAALASARA